MPIELLGIDIVLRIMYGLVIGTMLLTVYIRNKT